MHVLIADDNTHLADLFAARLELEGISVDSAYDGSTALRMAEKRLPDVAILDIDMPVMDGLELCRRLRALADARPMTVIALTGRSQMEDRRASADIGFDQHWIKPLSPDLLVGLLHGEVRRMAFATPDTASGEDDALRAFLERIRTAFAIDVVFVSQFVGSDRVVRLSCADEDDQAAIEAGASDPLEESYCFLIAKGEVPPHLPDAANSHSALPAQATRKYQIGSYLAVPVVDSARRVLGTVCCLNHSAGDGLSSAELLEELRSVAALCAEVLRSAPGVTGKSL